MSKRILLISLIYCFVLVCAGESEFDVSGGRFYEYSLKATLSNHDITNKQAIGVCYVQFFDEVLAPLKRYENVHILRTFLRQEEIYEYHKKNGIFLVPTRQDSQGVSKDEAMSSGLIPVTNAVTAISEFVDASCGVLSPGEDYLDMAHQIGRIVDNSSLFLSMSRAAAERVRRQTASDIIIQKEIDLIKGE